MSAAPSTTASQMRNTTSFVFSHDSLRRDYAAARVPPTITKLIGTATMRLASST